jgi:hypothetical protein
VADTGPGIAPEQQARIFERFARVESGSALAGGATMLAFGLGTLPSMLAVTLAGTAFTRRLSGLWTRRVAGVLMIVFAFWTAFGTFAPHGGGHGAGHGSGAPGSAAPAEPHRH